MAEIINLNRVRKAKARSDKAVSAAANRARFGRSKAEKKAEQLTADRLGRVLDGARRDPPAPAED